MELLKRFPEGFFQETRPVATPSNNPDDKIIPIKWSKEVLTGKKKAIVKLAKNSKNK